MEWFISKMPGLKQGKFTVDESASNLFGLLVERKFLLPIGDSSVSFPESYQG
jgi:hypothetical protein